MTIDPNSAVQKPSTWKPRFRPPEIALVSISIRALTTSSIRPRVSTISGSEIRFTIGRTNAVISPKMRPTTSSFRNRSRSLSPVRVIPSKSHTATPRATALTTTQMTIFMARA